MTLNMMQGQQLQGQVTVCKSHVECLGPKQFQISSDLSLRQNSCSDVDDHRMSSDRLFQTASAAAAKARSDMLVNTVKFVNVSRMLLKWLQFV